MAASARDVAHFNLAIDSKLRACDLVGLEIEDVRSGSVVPDRGTVAQRRTGRPVQVRDRGSDAQSDPISPQRSVEEIEHGNPHLGGLLMTDLRLSQ